MLINNRDIVLQGSGTINGGSGTPLSVPLPSGSSFMPKIDLKYMLEKVNNLVYPYSSTDVPVSYILMVHTHVQNYVSGSKEYEYFDCMDKIFYFMIHNGKYASYNGFKVLTNKVKVYEPNGTEIQIKAQTHNAEYESEFSGNKYTFNMLSTILNSDNGDHKSDAPLNYLNYFPNEVNKIKGILGSTGNNMIVDSAFIKSKPKDSQNELPNDGYLSRPNTIVSITLNYPKSYEKDLIICSIGNGFKVAKRIPIYPEISGDMTINKYKLINLRYYSRDNIANHNTITEYPTDEIGNIDYTMKTNGGTAEGCFAYCNNLTALDVSGFDTSKITNMNSIFYDCKSLTTLDVSNFDTSKVTNMGLMFYYCDNLTTLDVSNFNTSKVTNMSVMFRHCTSLTTLDLSGFDTSNVTDMNMMFYDCDSLTALDLSNFNTSKVTTMGYMFSGCTKLTTLDVSKWNTSKVENINFMFSSCRSLTTLDVSKWDTSNVIAMFDVFEACSSLTTLDVSKWDTSKVVIMNYMFEFCENLTTLDVSKWDTSNVTNMCSMFKYCINLTALDVSKWNTSKVADMHNMFNYCQNLTTLDVSKWDTSNVTDMNNMFYFCFRLVTLDLSNFNTSKVTDMNNMFGYLSSLSNLKLNFDMSSISDIKKVKDMFANCKITSGSIKFNNVKISVFKDRATFINAINGSGINSAILTVNFV